jgi:hypothetical protein
MNVIDARHKRSASHTTRTPELGKPHGGTFMMALRQLMYRIYM